MGTFTANKRIDHALLGRHEHVFFRRVVAKDGALGNPDALRDVSDRRGIKALFLNQAQRGVLDLPQHPRTALFTDSHHTAHFLI